MSGVLVTADFLDSLTTRLNAIADAIDPAGVYVVDYTVTGSATVESAAETAQTSERARATQVAESFRALAEHATSTRLTMDAVDDQLAGQG